MEKISKSFISGKKVRSIGESNYVLLPKNKIDQDFINLMENGYRVTIEVIDGEI